MKVKGSAGINTIRLYRTSFLLRLTTLVIALFYIFRDDLLWATVGFVKMDYPDYPTRDDVSIFINELIPLIVLATIFTATYVSNTIIGARSGYRIRRDWLPYIWTFVLCGWALLTVLFNYETGFEGHDSGVIAIGAGFWALLGLVPQVVLVPLQISKMRKDIIASWSKNSKSRS